MEGANEACVDSPFRYGIDVLRQVEAAVVQVLAITGQGHRTKLGAGEELERFDGVVGGGSFLVGLADLVPTANQREASQFHVVLRQAVLELRRILEITEPVVGERGQHHGLDPGEASFAGDLDHVVEFVVVGFAGTLHEPGVDFGSEFDFGHFFRS